MHTQDHADSEYDLKGAEFTDNKQTNIFRYRQSALLISTEELGISAGMFRCDEESGAGSWGWQVSRGLHFSFQRLFKICVLIKDYFLFLSIRQLATQLYIIIIIWQKF